LLLKSFIFFGRKIVKKYKFLTFLQNRQNVEKQHFYTENDDAEFGKEVFSHAELDYTIKKKILNSRKFKEVKIQKLIKNVFFLK
jgi:hypothetical protein